MLALTAIGISIIIIIAITCYYIVFPSRPEKPGVSRKAVAQSTFFDKRYWDECSVERRLRSGKPLRYQSPDRFRRAATVA
jgi:hypothetical protein